MRIGFVSNAATRSTTRLDEIVGEAAQADWPTLAAMLRSYALFGFVAWVALALALRRVRV